MKHLSNILNQKNNYLSLNTSKSHELLFTNKKYQLTNVFATEYKLTLSSGANQPVVLGAIDMNSHKKDEYVVKLKVGETMDSSANQKEVIAAFIAMEMDIPVIEPTAVQITSEFVDTVDNKVVKQRLKDSVGLNFGSTYIPDYSTIPLTSLPEKLVPYAQQIFAFDLLIQNLDRTRMKPNMLTNGEEIIVLDHEKAFGFTFASIVSIPANIWELNSDQKKWITDHVFYPYIKGKKFDFEGFSKKMIKLNDRFWSKVSEQIPGVWKTDQFEIIKDKITSFVNNKKQFIKELKINMS